MSFLLLRATAIEQSEQSQEREHPAVVVEREEEGASEHVAGDLRLVTVESHEVDREAVVVVAGDDSEIGRCGSDPHRRVLASRFCAARWRARGSRAGNGLRWLARTISVIES